MLRFRHLLPIVSLSLLTACPPAAPSETPKEPGNVMVDDDGKPAGGEARMASDTATPGNFEPAAAPGEVMLKLRWKSPGATLSTLASFTSLPAGMVSSASTNIVTEFLNEAAGSAVYAEKMAPLVKLDAPFDAVGVADTKRRSLPDPMFAWSLGLTSLDRALAASRGEHADLGNGVYRIGKRTRWGASCAIVSAVGAAPARLVCTEKERYLERMAAFVGRNVASEPSAAADVRAEVRMRGVLDKYGRQWANQARGLPIIAEEFKLGIPAFDTALLDAAGALAGEAGKLINDADAIVADLSFDRSKGVTQSVTMKFAGKQSWTLQTMVDGAGLASKAPDMFWNLPKNAQLATWGRGGDTARWEPILKVGRALLEGVMAKERFGTAGDRAALAKLLRFPMGKHVTTVGANGSFAGAPKGSSAPELIESMVGWHVVGVEEASTQVKTYLKDAVATYNRASLQRIMKKELGSDAKHLPKVRIVPAPRALGRDALQVKVVIPKLELPDDAFDRDHTDKGKVQPYDMEFHLLVMPDGQRTWIGGAADANKLAKLMEGLKAPAKHKLGVNIPQFKDERHNGGSFTSLSGIVGAIKPLLIAAVPKRKSRELEKAMLLIESMPNKGRTPVVFLGDVKDGPRPEVKISLTVPVGTLKDVGHLIDGLMKRR